MNDCTISILIKNPKLLSKTEQPDNVYLKVLSCNGLALKYIKKQTQEMCLTAVRQNGLALVYVRNQTEKICFRAILKDKLALMYVNQELKERLEKKIQRMNIDCCFDKNTNYNE